MWCDVCGVTCVVCVVWCVRGVCVCVRACERAHACAFACVALGPKLG